MSAILFLDSGTYTDKRVYHHEFYQGEIERGYLYELPFLQLENYQALIIPNGIDEIYLYEYKDKIHHFLHDGKLVVSFAQIYLPWLPGNTGFIRSPLSVKDRVVQANETHPIFQGVTEYDLNYRRGVKGFFSRGYFIPPVGSEVILHDQQGNVVLYLDEQTTNGTILCGAGTDLLGFGLLDTTTARRIGPQLIEWMKGKIEEKQI